MKMDKEKIVIHADIDIEDLVPDFLENQRMEALRIRNLLGSGDFSTIQGIGHSMKGAGGGYGFDEISAIGERIESAAKERSVDSLNDQVERLLDYLDRVEVVYDP